MSGFEKRGNLEQKSFLSYVDHIIILLDKSFLTNFKVATENGHSEESCGQ